jgi:hypothetical protein
MEITGINSNNTDTLTNIIIASFTAGHYSGTATIKVWAYVNGFLTTEPETITISVIEPNGGLVVQKINTGIWHVQNTDSVGFLGRCSTLPSDVSFWKVEFHEGGGNANANGYFSFLNNKPHPPNGENEWFSISKGINPDINLPNVWGAVDTISGGTYTVKSYSVGWFDWPIQWLFKIGSRKEVFTTVHHIMTIDDQGDMSISKGGRAVSAKYGDNRSNY